MIPKTTTTSTKKTTSPTHESRAPCAPGRCSSPGRPRVHRGAITGRGAVGARSRGPEKASPDAVDVAVTGRGAVGARSREPAKASSDALNIAIAVSGAVGLLAATMVPSVAFGQSTSSITLSRVEVVRRAAEQNPQVASARAEIYRSEALQNQVFAARFPSLSVRVGIATSLQADLVDENGATSRRSAYDDFEFDQLSAAFVGQALATQPLYTFGKIDLRGEAADHGLRAQRAQVRMTQADVAFEAAQIYEGLIYANEVLRFLDDLDGIAEKTLEQTEDLLDDGAPDVSEQDILRVKSAQGLAALGRTEAEAGVSQAIEGLRAYLGIDRGVIILPEDEYLEPISMKPSRLEDLIDLAMNNRAEFDALREGILGYERLADAESAGYYPNIFLAGFVTAAYTPGRDLIQSRYVFDPLGHFVPAALIGAQWDIQWDMAGQRANEVRADAIKLTGLLKWAEQGIPAEVNQVYQEVVRARADIAQLEETIPLTKQWLVRASANYGVGLGPSRDVADAVTNYVLLKTAQLKAVYRLNIALAQLAKVTGTLPDGDSPLYPGRGSKQ